MRIQRRSIITNQWNEMEIPVDRRKYIDWELSNRKEHVQNAFPELSAEEREFLLTGITPQEWKEHVCPEEEENG